MPAKIKKRNACKNKIKVPTGNEIQLDYPVFCFRHLQSVPDKDFKFYSDFIVRLKKISELTWSQIGVAPRHGFGTEKMPVKQIKVQLPNFVSPDVSDLIVFRANGDNRPFLGLRRGIVFHVIFIEEQFGDIYDHE